MRSLAIKGGWLSICGEISSKNGFRAYCVGGLLYHSFQNIFTYLFIKTLGNLPT